MPKAVSNSRSTGRATLAAVGAHAGVSSMTASRALTRPDLVSDDVRRRVQQAVAALGYVPNRAARSLASSASNVIVALVPSLSNFVFNAVIEGIEEVADAANYQLLIGNTRYSDAEEEKLLGIYLQSNPLGILLTGLTHSARVAQLVATCGVPVVSMMDLSTIPGVLSVGFSQHEAGRAMTCYLIGKGHRRIAFIGAQLDERTVPAWRSSWPPVACRWCR